ncbi:uncharacterized protein LOC122641615 [Telopea speciosissima]|uniref:uncharacterized protein LOC122641615 n=1 Tax=Telopea speciosissima TaxID=54955 RepID=UPI001CC35091|nr:uncharacterized protein LOC122641615 [Telopea speciosissima]XP_043690836.1 uncharacterized protein LOC122641615 [Telopea speciosissima]
MQRLWASGISISASQAVPRLKRKALNSWSAVQDTYFSTKDIFERHRVVFTVSTSLASIATAWFGYSLRYLHQAKVEERLESIENAMKNNSHIEHAEIKNMVGSGNVSTAACVATAGTSLVIGYGLGWRGGIWYANRKFRQEQMKLLGQIKPRRWQMQFLKRPNARHRGPESAVKTPEALHSNISTTTTTTATPTSQTV